MGTPFIGLFVSCVVALLLPETSRAAPDIRDTRLLASPAVCAKHMAFVYADDLWIADLDGRNLRRLHARWLRSHFRFTRSTCD